MLSAVTSALSVIVVVSALAALLHRRPAYSILFFLLTFIGISGLFFCLRAEYIGVVQVIVYAGALLVIFLFALMLIGREPQYGASPIKAQNFLALAALTAFLVIGLRSLARFYSFPAATEKLRFLPNGPDVRDLASTLLSRHVLPFEVASILLLAAIIAAIYIAGREED